MKHVLYICCVLIISCTSQKNVPSAQIDTSVTANEEVNSKTSTKTSTAEGINKTVTDEQVIQEEKGGVKCIDKLIAKFKDEDVQNPPRKIFSYTYKGKLVYYVTPPCCDFFSDLYDDNCNLIAHPDGGITGKGDGKAKDFIATRTNEKLVWEDDRKYR